MSNDPKHDAKPDAGQNPQPDDLRHPTPSQHSDDQRSAMPERDDKDRKQAPSDRPGKQSGEGETPVG